MKESAEVFYEAETGEEKIYWRGFVNGVQLSLVLIGIASDTPLPPGVANGRSK